METRRIDVISAGILVADMLNEPVDRLPVAGELLQVDNITAFVGGCAGNVAINLAKQDLSVALMGKVGNDPQGRFVRDSLERQGVDATRIAVSETGPTSQTMILLVKGEDRRFLHCFGANRDFRVSDIDRDTARRATVFYLGGYLVMPALDAREVADLLADLRGSGVKVVLDVVIPSGTTDFAALDAVLPHVDLFAPNDDEAAMITGKQEPVEQAKALAERGAATVVITCGGEGSVLLDGGRLLKAGAYRTDAVDPSGGGDAFDAGFITGLVRGWPLEKTLAYASALGSSCVSAVGCHAGTFTAAQASAFIEKNKLATEWID